MTQSLSTPSVAETGHLATAPWRTSSRSQTSNCVEFAPLDGGPAAAALRDSKDRTGPVLLFGRASWTDFVTSARTGRFHQG